MGAVVAVAGAVGLSFIIDPPDPPKPDAVALDVPVGSEFNQSRMDDRADLPKGEPVQQGVPVSRVSPPAPDDLTSLTESDTRPAEVPQTGRPAPAISAPDDAAPSPELSSVGRDAPITQVVGAGDSPVAPPKETRMTIPTEPPRPAAPTAIGDVASPATQSEAPSEPALPELANDIDLDLQGIEKSDERPGSASGSVVAPVTGAEDEELVIRIDPAPAPSVEIAEPQAQGTGLEPDADDASPVPPSSTQDVGERRDEAGPVPMLPRTPETGEAQVEVQGTAERRDTPETPDVPLVRDRRERDGDGEQAIAIGTPATRLTDRADGFSQSGRVRIGTAATAPTPRETQAPDSPAPAEQPPFQKYSETAEVAENKPKMAIVLIDDPEADVGIEALSTFPYALSFAVDTNRADAADRMAMYRAAGFEVLALVDLPEGAGAGDVEVAMQVLLERVPEAVGVMEAPGDGIQSSREIVTQVTEIVENSGHGLLLYPKGLDTGRKLASKAGVPAASIFRDFDAKDEKPSVIRRFLNYAALKAGSEQGGVVMVGRLRPDTVTALLLWGLEDRARDIALTPVSAIMQAQQGEG